MPGEQQLGFLDSSLGKAWRAWAFMVLGYPLGLVLVYWLMGESRLGGSAAPSSGADQFTKYLYCVLSVSLLAAAYLVRKHKLSTRAAERFKAEVTDTPVVEQRYIQAVAWSVVLTSAVGYLGLPLFVRQGLAWEILGTFVAMSVLGMMAFCPRRDEIEQLAQSMGYTAADLAAPVSGDKSRRSMDRPAMGSFHMDRLRKINRTFEIACYVIAGAILLIGGGLMLLLLLSGEKALGGLILAIVISVLWAGYGLLFRLAVKHFDERRWRLYQTFVHLPAALMV